MPDILGKPDQIAEHYRRAIRAGELASGDELPSNRNVALAWKVSTATVLAAMAQLREGGWIVSRPGKKPVVSDNPPTRQ